MKRELKPIAQMPSGKVRQRGAVLLGDGGIRENESSICSAFRSVLLLCMPSIRSWRLFEFTAFRCLMPELSLIRLRNGIIPESEDLIEACYARFIGVFEGFFRESMMSPVCH